MAVLRSFTLKTVESKIRYLILRNTDNPSILLKRCLACRSQSSSLWPLYSEVTSFPDPTTLIRWMKSGCALLIPYDCDKNNEPALRGGHGAHWSLLCIGNVVFSDELHTNPVDPMKIFRP
uniref:Actin maturation protease n=1 Tax=Angiostrongylus cantonensis TaxID=6313 RepID=A0A0K0DI85_ANGCA